MSGANDPRADGATLPRERISAAIRAPQVAGEPAIVAFLTAGYPSAKLFREHLAAVAAGSDVVEIGVPFTDPMADGPAIQAASLRALATGARMTRTLVIAPQWIGDAVMTEPLL